MLASTLIVDDAPAEEQEQAPEAEGLAEAPAAEGAPAADSARVLAPEPTERTLRLAPEPELLELTQLAIEPYLDLGLDLRIEAGGVPLRAADAIGNKCGRAVTDVLCTFDECEAAGARIWIRRSPSCMKRIVVAHEIGHVISRWGRCAASGADRAGHVSGATELLSELGGGLIGPQSRQLICACGVCPATAADE